MSKIKAVAGIGVGIAIGLAVGIGGTVGAHSPELERLVDLVRYGDAETTEHVLNHADAVRAQIDDLREIIEGHHGQVIDACE